jgi:hypothetical protein
MGEIGRAFSMNGMRTKFKLESLRQGSGFNLMEGEGLTGLRCLYNFYIIACKQLST